MGRINRVITRGFFKTRDGFISHTVATDQICTAVVLHYDKDRSQIISPSAIY
jgi:hypothetical protein